MEGKRPINMMDSQIILSAKRICKSYTVNQEEFIALNNIDFDLKKGEILGVIGNNGAGKSTLLKILAQAISVNDGEIEYEGKILSILEIGTGFHPELSGYENIYFNAALLGMKKNEIEQNIPSIIEFSGVGEFIYEPVKNYSNGMYLRLALSVALHADFSIILIDEVIAVGDAEFRLKALKKLRDKIKEGRSCILISHDMNTVAQICTRSLVLNKGDIIFSGKTADAIQLYLDLSNKKNVECGSSIEGGKLSLISLTLEKEVYYTDEPVKIIVRYNLKQPEITNVILKVNQHSGPVLMDGLLMRMDYIPEKKTPGIYETECEIPANLLNKGIYTVDVIIGSMEELFIETEFYTKFVVKHREWEAEKNWNNGGIIYPLRPHCNWKTRPL